MLLTEKASKKIGEVLAFAVVGKETIEKSPAYVEIFANQSAHIEIYSRHISQLNELAKQLDAQEIVDSKLEGTGAKLRNMRDTYIGHEWDNAMEIMEWLGFFEGAAIVHWKLVLGTAQKNNNDILQELATDAIAFHENILATVGNKISQDAPL